jgi:hypothetical protein
VMTEIYSLITHYGDPSIRQKNKGFAYHQSLYRDYPYGATAYRFKSFQIELNYLKISQNVGTS